MYTLGQTMLGIVNFENVSDTDLKLLKGIYIGVRRHEHGSL